MSGNAPPSSIKEIIWLAILIICSVVWGAIKYPFKKLFGGK